MHDTTRQCLILAAGEYYPSTGPALRALAESGGVNPHDDARDAGPLIIAADGGFDHAHALGLPVDLLIGDFDSIHDRPHAGERMVRLPSQKDDSDALAAVKAGWARRARDFHIFGSLGGRIDHTIANIQMTAMLAHCDASCYLYGDDAVVTAICDAALHLSAVDECPPGRSRMVSVFSHSDISRDVNESGMAYTLHHATMDNGTVRGLSNELVDDQAATIDVHDGTLLVTFPPRAVPVSVLRYRTHGGAPGALNTHVSDALVHRPEPSRRHDGAQVRDTERNEATI